MNLWKKYCTRTLGAIKAISIADDSDLLILSSDHDIRDERIYKSTRGIPYLNEDGCTGLFQRSQTGYGYIKSINPLDHKNIRGKIYQIYWKTWLCYCKKSYKRFKNTYSGIFYLTLIW